jgi:hypothetical protein
LKAEGWATREVVDIPADVITPEHAARMRAVPDELQNKRIADLASRAALRTTVHKKNFRPFDFKLPSLVA